MSTAIPTQATRECSMNLGWILVGLVPVTALIMSLQVPAWALMWILGVATFGLFKWLTFAKFGGLEKAGSVGRAVAYFVAWPGMDARAFFASARTATAPTTGQWLAAAGKTLLGVALFWGAARLVPGEYWLLQAWVGMTGLIFILHFGTMHLIALGWRSRGVNVRPLMNAPIAANSLADFWGKRWNLAFRDLAHMFVFRPSVSKLGVAWATMAVFLFSGVLHDLVLSLPAGGGLGLPTLYFLIQGAALLFERSRLGKRLGLGRGLRGRAYVFVFTGVGALMLFHPVFLTEVVLPMMSAWGAI